MARLRTLSDELRGVAPCTASPENDVTARGRADRRSTRRSATSSVGACRRSSGGARRKSTKEITAKEVTSDATAGTGRFSKPSAVSPRDRSSTLPPATVSLRQQLAHDRSIAALLVWPRGHASCCLSHARGSAQFVRVADERATDRRAWPPRSWSARLRSTLRPLT